MPQALVGRQFRGCGSPRTAAHCSPHAGQFGPNATTWLLPAEIVPTEMRSMSHGFAAAVGKAGALVAGVVFGLVNDRTKFWISAACGLAGVFVTVIFMPGARQLAAADRGVHAPTACWAAPAANVVVDSRLAGIAWALRLAPHPTPLRLTPGPRASHPPAPCRHHQP